jgi:hypothetical protein
VITVIEKYGTMNLVYPSDDLERVTRLLLLLSQFRSRQCLPHSTEAGVRIILRLFQQFEWLPVEALREVLTESGISLARANWAIDLVDNWCSGTGLRGISDLRLPRLRIPAAPPAHGTKVMLVNNLPVTLEELEVQSNIPWDEWEELWPDIEPACGPNGDPLCC